MKGRERIERTVLDAIRGCLAEKGAPRPDLGPDTAVDASLGLDSLDWAAVVVQLEGELGVDPFASGVDRELRTVRDLVEVYDSACG